MQRTSFIPTDSFTSKRNNRTVDRSGGRSRILSTTAAVLILAASFAAAPISTAANLNWDANAALAGTGGTGIWDTTTALWDDGLGNFTTWNNATPDSAVFPTSAGLVTLATAITAAQVNFNAAYTVELNGNNMTVNGPTTGTNISSTIFRNTSATHVTYTTGSITPTNNGGRFTGNLSLTLGGNWTPGAVNDFTGTLWFKPTGIATILTSNNNQLGTATGLIKLEATGNTANINFSAGGQFHTYTRNIDLIHGVGTFAQFQINGAKEITLAGVIGGGTALGNGLRLTSNQGNLVLAGANTYAGSTQLTGQSSILTLAHNNALGASTSINFMNSGAKNTLGFRNSVTINQPGALDLGNNAPADSGFGSLHAFTGDNTFTGNVSMSTNGPTLLGANAGSSLTLTGVLGGASRRGMVKVGFGTVVLTGANTFGRLNASTNVNATAVNEGTLRLDFSQAAIDQNIINNGIADFTSNQVSELSLGGGTLEVIGKAGATNVQQFKDRSGATLAANPGFTIMPGASEVLALRNGAASLTINLGRLNAGVRFPGSSVNFTLPDGASVVLPAGGIGTPNTILTSNGTAFATVGGNDWAALDVSQSMVGGGATIANFYTANTASVLAGNADMSADLVTTLTGSPTLTSLRFNHPGARSIDVTGQTLTTGGILVTPAAGNNPQVISGGTLQAASGAANQDLVILQNNAAGILRISSVIADNLAATGLTKSGPGTLVLGAVNPYTGETHLNGGIVQLLPGSALGSGKLFFHGGVLGLPGGTTFTRAVTAGAGNDTVQFLGSGGFAAYGDDVTINLGGAAATLTMGGTTGFVPTGSALILGSADSTGTVTVLNPIFLRAANQPQPREIRVENGSADVDAKLAGGLPGANQDGGLTKTGAGTLEIAGAVATYAGPTIIEAGTIRLGLAGAVPNTPLTVRAGTLDLNGFGFTASNGITLGGGSAGTTSAITGPLTLSSNLTYNGNVASDNGATLSGGVAIGTAIRTFTVNDSAAAAQDLVVSAVITGTSGGGITKTGNGTMLLSGSNNYPSATTVSGGTLLVSGSIGGTNGVSVQNSGTLGGSGTLNLSATVTVAAGGTIAPGIDVGMLNTGTVTFTGGALALQITDATTYDQLNVTGALNLNGPIALSLSLASTFAPGTSFTVVLNDGIDAVGFNNGVTGFSFNSMLLSDGDEFTVTGPFGAQSFQISYDGDGANDFNDVTLTAVPEPGSAAMLFAGLGALFGARRMRRRS